MTQNKSSGTFGGVVDGGLIPKNTVVAGNAAKIGPDIPVFTSLGHNLIGTLESISSAGTILAASDQLQIDLGDGATHTVRVA